MCWKSVDNDDDVPVTPMDVTCECTLWLRRPNSDAQRLAHCGQMVPKSDEGRSWACCCRWWRSWRWVSRAWVRSASNDVTPVLEIDLQDGRSAASDSKSLAGLLHSLRMEWLLATRSTLSMNELTVEEFKVPVRSARLMLVAHNLKERIDCWGLNVLLG